MRQILGWTCLAILGLAISVGVTVVAGSLSSQTVGLGAEPIEASDTLAPPASTSASPPDRPRTRRRRQNPKPRERTTPEATPAAPPTAAPTSPPPAAPGVPVAPPADGSDDRRSDDGEKRGPSPDDRAADDD